MIVRFVANPNLANPTAVTRSHINRHSFSSMKKSIWQSRTALILAGIMLGLVARGILGSPEADTPVGPSFENPLPEDVPFSVPLSKPQGAINE